MLRVERQKVKEEGAVDNPWSAGLSVNEEEKKKTMMTPRPKKKTMVTPQPKKNTMLTPRPPSSSPPRKSKGTQTEKEEEEDKEEERNHIVKQVDAMIRLLNTKQTWATAYPQSRPRRSRKLVC